MTAAGSSGRPPGGSRGRRRTRRPRPWPREQGRRVVALGKVDPEEVAAARDHEFGLGDLLAAALLLARRGGGERALDELDVAVERAGAAELQDDRLGEHVRRDVVLVPRLASVLISPAGAGQVADPDPGADRLGEGGGVDDAAGAGRGRASSPAPRPRREARGRGRPQRSRSRARRRARPSAPASRPRACTGWVVSLGSRGPV